MGSVNGSWRREVSLPSASRNRNPTPEVACLRTPTLGTQVLTRDQVVSSVDGAIWPIAALQRWALHAGVFLLPLAYLPSFYDRWVLPKLLLARLLVLVLLAMWLARAVQERRIVIRRTPLDVVWLVFLGSASLSTVLATNVNVAVFGIYSRYDGLLTFLTYAAVFWLAVQSIDGPDQARSLLRTLLAGAYVAAAIAIVQTVADTMKAGTLARAYGTFGQWNVLGTFLAMAWPLALSELASARSAAGRVLAANVCLVVGAALLLTFSRSAWIAAALGSAVVVARGSWWRDKRMPAIAAAIGIAGLVLVAGLALVGGSRLEGAVVARASTVLEPAEWGPRPLIWRDSLRLIAASPIIGYGPDTFGLVYPRFDTVYFHEPIDKAHAEVLQIAATQGLVGIAAYAFMVIVFLRAFWTGRSSPGAYALLGAFVAYEGSLQVNFTALGSAFPFWIFAAAAFTRWGAVRPATASLSPRALLGARLAPIVLAGIAVVGVLLPSIAEASLLAAVRADSEGRTAAARAAANEASTLQPQESVYAVELANIAFEHGDWATARAEYMDAARLGTYNPLVFRNLAFADRNLGLTAEARAAALAAYELNWFDPANQAVLAQFGGPNP